MSSRTRADHDASGIAGRKRVVLTGLACALVLAGPCQRTAIARQLAETAARACTYRGAFYPDGAATYGDPCPGQACGAVAGPLLNCRDGQWFYTSGVGVCSAYAQAKASPLWAAMAEGVKQAQAAYFKSLGCPD